MKIKKVALFGDSILKGVVLDDNNRYCFSKALDWERVENAFGVSIINKSRFGCEITKGQRIVNDFLLAGSDVDVAVLEYGGNDSDFAWGDVAASPFAVHRSRTGLVDFQQKLRTVVWQLQSKGIRVIMMSLPPLDAERYLDWISRGDEQRKDSIMSFLGDVSRIYRYQEIYSNAVTKIALENGCEFVDVRQEFLQSGSFRDLMCADGIHPNEKGQKVIIDAFLARYGDTALAKAN
mgnify:FL=1